ncbi:hypothetical protein BKA82DRAFT_29385 [Pisolithus tinctorius]|uniref:Uncharacterized protein n=1 Tax=Pisolithus tinctorius Marx 270 TaxID=870435 RepID=A0A0C3NI86_PISTI|nr:hypothetical protein BKA82DRAFT_29385 [Pisolithus tinctorius]KIO00730.1 hypothetical protein M404DRAFT_29385 [Pisolithus tinctorius Marx 270]
MQAPGHVWRRAGMTKCPSGLAVPSDCVWGFKESLCLPLIIPGVRLITCGHWLRGMIVEGLAWTAVHPAGATTLISRLLFIPEPTSLLTELEKQSSVECLALMLRDTRFFGSRVLDKHEFAAMLESHGEIFNKYAEMRCCNTKNQEDLEKYLEEIIFADMLMYGVGSRDGDDAEYRANCFTGHIVTSALFLPSLCVHISHRSQTLLLRAHFLTSITWWVVHGRSPFPLKEFTTTPLPPFPNSPSAKHSTTLSGPQPAAASDALPSPKSPHRQAGFVMESLSRNGVDADPSYAYLGVSVFLRVAWLTSAAFLYHTLGVSNMVHQTLPRSVTTKRVYVSAVREREVSTSKEERSA